MENCNIYHVKLVYGKQWDKIIEAVIQKDAQPLYILDLSYFPFTESANLSVTEGQVEGTVFEGMANQEEYQYDLHSSRENREVSPVIGVQRLTWGSWYIQFSRTLYDYDMTHYDAQF